MSLSSGGIEGEALFPGALPVGLVWVGSPLPLDPFSAFPICSELCGLTWASHLNRLPSPLANRFGPMGGGGRGSEGGRQTRSRGLYFSDSFTYNPFGKMVCQPSPQPPLSLRARDPLPPASFRLECSPLLCCYQAGIQHLSGFPILGSTIVSRPIMKVPLVLQSVLPLSWQNPDRY